MSTFYLVCECVSCEATSGSVSLAPVHRRTCCYCSSHITVMCHGTGRGAVRVGTQPVNLVSTSPSDPLML